MGGRWSGKELEGKGGDQERGRSTKGGGWWSRAGEGKEKYKDIEVEGGAGAGAWSVREGDCSFLPEVTKPSDGDGEGGQNV